QEVRGHLRRRRVQCQARYRQGARSAALAVGVGDPYQGRTPRRPLIHRPPTATVENSSRCRQAAVYCYQQSTNLFGEPMAGDTIITVVGNLVDHPELRFTPSGAAVANFRLASTPRQFDRQTGEWKDGDTLFLSCAVWRQAAENVAESLEKGMRVIVQGRLK